MGSQTGKNEEKFGAECTLRRTERVKEKSLKLNKRAHKRCSADAQDRKSNRFRRLDGQSTSEMQLSTLPPNHTTSSLQG